MANFNVHPSKKEIKQGMRNLTENEYPGRAIIMGLNSAGSAAVQAYILSGRSPGSRNRVFSSEGGGGRDVRVVAPDMTPEQMSEVEHANLIYYLAMTESGDGHFVVSNGAQTQPVTESLAVGKSLAGAVRAAPTVEGVDLSMYEPDTPNNTPRITGALTNRIETTNFGLSVVRKKLAPILPYALLI